MSFYFIGTFFLAIVIGTILLSLPVATHQGSIKLVDALFTSTSAVTVTGLIVVDTATYFTLFGQMVILILLQFGGLGFMTLSTLIILLVGKSMSIKEKFFIENDFTTGSYQNIRDLLKKIFLMTFVFEFLGAIIFYFQLPDLKGPERIFSSTFHSVSAFCNAGFSVSSNSFENFVSHWGINLTLMFLIICGGIGFLVLNEVYLFIRRKIKKTSKFSLHSKLVLISSSILIFSGTLIIFIEEIFNPTNSLPLGSKFLSSMFQSVTARTAGFNTINIKTMTSASIFIILILMFIGASPGSTGGGVKTSTFGMVFAFFRARIRGFKNVNFFFRKIPNQTIEKAFIVIILSLALVSASFLLLLTFETKFRMVELLFETISAFGTVGLSLGITPHLTLPSKIIIIITMFVGRIGPLTLFVAMSRRETRAVFNYPEENIMIG